jgi:hypothetical protein
MTDVVFIDEPMSVTLNGATQGTLYFYDDPHTYALIATFTGEGNGLSLEAEANSTMIDDLIDALESLHGCEITR